MSNIDWWYFLFYVDLYEHVVLSSRFNKGLFSIPNLANTTIHNGSELM